MKSKTEKTTADLLLTLDTLATLLRRYKVAHWADWISGDAQRIRFGDSTGIEHLLSAYGGMGSLNDLVICVENGHPIADEDVSAVNEAFLSLKTRAYELAQQVRRTRPSGA